MKQHFALFVVILLFVLSSLGYFHFSFAQEGFGQEKLANDLGDRKERAKTFFNKLEIKLKEAGKGIFYFWKGLHREISQGWKEKTLPRIENWLAKEKVLIEKEFRKEVVEMKEDIKRIFIEKTKSLLKF